MPDFAQDDGFDTIAYEKGAAQVFLGIKFSPTPVAHFSLAIRGGGKEGETLDEEQIREAVQAGVAGANAASGRDIFVGEVFYDAGDSARYELFAWCAFLLASRRTGNGG